MAVPEDWTVVDPRDVPTASFHTCDDAHRKLTEALGAMICASTRSSSTPTRYGAFGTA